MNRGEGTPPATKSGRKVKRPAHFDDSPEPASPGKLKKEVAAPESVKKSARKTLVLSAGTPPAKNGSDSEEAALGKKSARKTLASKNGSREESPEPVEVKKAAPASARKTLLKSAVQNSSAEGGTPKKTPAKKVAEPEPDSDAGLSRTGRKIKVPAHLKEFEDVVVPAVSGRKSVAPKKEPEAVPKSATKSKTVVRQLATEHEEEKPEPKTPAKAKQARKVAEEDEEEEAKPVTKTPGRARSVARKTVEEEEEETKPVPKARGRSVARKASVDEPAPFEEKPIPKTYGRARSFARQTEQEDDAPKSPVKPVEAPKTPGRAKAVPRRFADDDEEEARAPKPKTPGRAKSMAARKPSVDEPAAAPPTKTPRRAKSIAPQSKPDEEDADPLALPVEEPPKPTKTPSKPRAKSVAREPSPEPSEPAPTSRSGRKIKPKKYFGEFEQDESVPAVVPTTTKVASPVKSPKVIAASPVRSPQQQIVKKGSPYAPKKDMPALAKPATTTTTSPVKRLSVPERKSPAAAAAVVPTKKAKKDEANADGEGSPFKVSPATEQRQITKRNVNDHHHPQQQQVATTKPESPKVVLAAATTKVVASPAAAATKSVVSPPKKAKLDSPPNKPVAAVSSEPELIPEQDPLAGGSSSTSNVTESSDAATTTPPAPPKEVVAEKPKRGRKTLPAASAASEDSVDDVPQKPKTPGRKTMAPAAVTPASLEEPGSSRSGRKIKPKKFFDDGEPAPAKVKPEVATPAGRGGKRKTIVAPKEEDKKEEEDKKKEKKEEPKASVSREEIMAIVGDFGAPVVAEAPVAAAAPAEAEPMNGTPEETSDATEAAIEPTTTTDTDAASTEVDKPAAADSTEEPVTEPELELQHPTTDDAHDQVAEASAGNFPETPIEQTPPIAEMEKEQETEKPTTVPTVPDDPVPSAELSEAEPEPVPAAEQSASSAFSEALVVEEEPPASAAGASGGPTVEEKMEELFESVEFLEESSGRLSDVTAAAAAVADGVPAEMLERELGEVMGEVVPEVSVGEGVQGDETEPPTATEEPTLESVQQEAEEEDLNKTEPPATLNDTVEDGVGQNQDEDLLATSMPDEVDEFFAENDRSQESITVLPETPKQKPALDQEDLDLIGKLPEPQQSSSNTVAFVEIPTPATPKTPESKPARIAKDDYSPDKPDAQEQASEPQELQKQTAPPEIIEIFDSPVVATAVEPTTENQATTSTPVGPPGKLTVKERLIQNSRKRSLSASDADLSTKKNVTFHSPANSTILVDTLDERLKKSLKADSKSKTARKRSLSEHKEMGGPSADPTGPKPSKISKLPNFKNIHQNQFSRMESIAEYHNRKVQRAKEITGSASKSPAVARGATPQKSGPHSVQKNGSSVATQLKFSAAAPKPSASHATTTTAATSSKPLLLSDEARQEKRQQQFKAAFKPKTAASTLAADSGKSHQDSPDGTRRVVEQSRHKQHQILKGVRTNKRFELLMKFRDAAQD